MTLKEQAEELIWYWKGEPKKLKYLTTNQLHSIKKVLRNSKNTWFGHKPEYWLNAIKIVDNYKSKNDTTEAINLIIDRRISNANIKANTIANTIVRCMNKNEGNKTTN